MCDKYNEKVFRKEKFEMYKDKQRAESLMIEKLIEQLKIKDCEELKEYIIIIGDWKGNNNLKNSKSTLGIGMKRILKRYVKKMYLINEYNTSRVSNLNYEMYKKEDKNKNKKKDQDKSEHYICKEHVIEITSKTKETKEVKVINKKIHGILTFKMDKKRIQCKYLSPEETVLRLIQRDKNAVLNFKTITRHYLKYGTRPNAFSRNNARK
jgi:hypothetical protein